jgi:polar amino acid transport system substrate-binding protein
MTKGQADICFLAIEPAREAEIAFTAPYVVIEGVFVVRRDSAITASADVDREGVRIGVKQGSAYDLYLSRSLQHASVVRGDEGVDVFCDLGLEVAAGIRQPMTEFVDLRPEFGCSRSGSWRSSKRWEPREPALPRPSSSFGNTSRS